MSGENVEVLRGMRGPEGGRPTDAFTAGGRIEAVEVAARGVGDVAEGTVTEFGGGLNPGWRLKGIAPGADGNVWFGDSGTTKAIGRITPTGTITNFTVGLNVGTSPLLIAPGPDGNLWFTDL